MTLGCPGCRIRRNKKPRVGGSIPSLATIQVDISNQEVKPERFASTAARLRHDGAEIRTSDPPGEAAARTNE